MSQWRCITATGATCTRYEEIPHYPEGLYEIGNRLYAWMVPNGSWGESNAGLIIGDGEALLVDTLWDVGYTYEMLQTMKPVLADVPLKYVVNAHTRGDLMVYVPDAKVLYSGDIVFNASTPVMWAGPVENYLAALDRILAMEVETVVPGHGAITDKEGVRQVKS